MYEKGRYKSLTNEEIKKDLEKEGYKPLLITEEANDFLETHNHQQSHILVVVDGEMKVVLTDKEIVMKPGDTITIDSQVPHAAYFGPAGCKYFWIEY